MTFTRWRVRWLLLGLMAGVALVSALHAETAEELQAKLNSVKTEILVQEGLLKEAKQSEAGARIVLQRLISGWESKIAADEKDWRYHLYGCPYVRGDKNNEPYEFHKSWSEAAAKTLSDDKERFAKEYREKQKEIADTVAIIRRMEQELQRLRSKVSSLEGDIRSANIAAANRAAALKAGQTPAPAKVVTPSPATPAPRADDAPWGFGPKYNPQPGLPKQPEAARWYTSDGKEVTPPSSPNSDLWGSTQARR